ncbi:MAG: hypothetical protein Q8R98_03780, partial [Rubrivivax sp.]|nr:hypothetical protein [Rubrivivax sp.]
MADFARLGVSVQQLQAAAPAPPVPAQAEPDDGLVLAAHLWPAVQLANALRTQARVVAGMAGLLYLGLDYARFDGVKRDLGLPMRGPKAALLLRQFQTVEREMVLVWNNRPAV